MCKSRDMCVSGRWCKTGVGLRQWKWQIRDIVEGNSVELSS